MAKTNAKAARVFEKGDRVEKAQQAYLVLIGMASRRQLMTYAEVADFLGYENERGFTYVKNFLWPLAAWCKERNLPILPAIVVNGKDGYPKFDGIYGGPTEWAKELQRVFDRDWYKYYPPTSEELDAALAWAKTSYLFN